MSYNPFDYAAKIRKVFFPKIHRLQIDIPELQIFSCFTRREQYKNLRFWLKCLIVNAVSFGPLYPLRNLIMEGSPLVQQTAGTLGKHLA